MSLVMSCGILCFTVEALCVVLVWGCCVISKRAEEMENAVRPGRAAESQS